MGPAFQIKDDLIDLTIGRAVEALSVLILKRGKPVSYTHIHQRLQMQMTRNYLSK